CARRESMVVGRGAFDFW
nr:immunoglobulin heavy chain junction region [Macaca mulatta]MOV53279.1 immunoglobulin heavy chain junction region [Macaca mulatta]MOV53323.1 immunoglobulin heavy chain junction region [Macaca mulatta]MOV53361.1 immunoglobulin heavy chain junction region [Macaca mulatta]MOV53410.1 immunoglobulin heavy chain junction region [Macaca mulatta]